MTIQIKKIKRIPFEISNEDEILVENLSLDEVPLALEELGFSKRKEKVINGTMVYYKTRRNGVYLSYKHTNQEENKMKSHTKNQVGSTRIKETIKQVYSLHNGQELQVFLNDLTESDYQLKENPDCYLFVNSENKSVKVDLDGTVILSPPKHAFEFAMEAQRRIGRTKEMYQAMNIQ